MFYNFNIMINIEKIINDLSQRLGLKSYQVKNTLNLIQDGNTIPFIARYRKELTGNLDEEKIFQIHKEYDYQLSLEEKKIWTINAIDKKGKITVSLEIKKEKAIIKISNNGEAISKEKQQMIFTEGFTTKPTGSGLGLHICATNLKAQNAVLKLNKSTKDLTEFEIDIPTI